MDRGGKQHQNEQSIQIFVLDYFNFHKQKIYYDWDYSGRNPFYANNNLFHPSQATPKIKKYAQVTPVHVLIFQQQIVYADQFSLGIEIPQNQSFDVGLDTVFSGTVVVKRI